MDAVVVTHVLLGVALLLLGLVAVLAPKRRRRSPHRWAGRAYVALLIYVLVTGMVIGARNAGVTPFELATPPTLAAGLLGFAAARGPLRRRLGTRWRAWHLVSMGSSFIGVVTATAFQIVPRVAGTGPVVMVLTWALPTVVGSVLIARGLARHGLVGPRPAAGGQGRGVVADAGGGPG